MITFDLTWGNVTTFWGETVQWDHMLLVSNENETKCQHLSGRKELRYEHISFAIKRKPHPNSYLKIQKKEL